MVWIPFLVSIRGTPPDPQNMANAISSIDIVKRIDDLRDDSGHFRLYQKIYDITVTHILLWAHL